MVMVMMAGGGVVDNRGVVEINIVKW
jgi:hypothetical protein